METQRSVRNLVVGLLVLVGVGFLGVRIGEVIATRQAVTTTARPGQNGARPGGMGPGGGGRGAEAVAVEVQPIARGAVEETTVLSGSLEPQYQVDVFSRRAGRLARMNVREGQRVRTGEPLAAVEHSDLLLQQQQAVAGLAASKASYRKTEAQRDKVAADYERVKLLYEQRASTQQELRNVTDQLREAEIQLEVAKAQLQQAESNVAIVKLQLNQVNTEASVSGVVIRTFGVVGSQVTTSTPVATIAGVDPIEVVFSVAEKDIGRLRAGQDFSVSVDAYPEEIYRGKITSLGAVVEAATRTLPVRGRVPNSALRLRPGMFARVTLTVGQKNNVLCVPREALLTSATGGAYVFVVTDGVAEMRPVTVGIQGRERVEILTGLKEGEPVAVVGHQQLRDGQVVRTLAGPGKPERRPSGGPQRRPGQRGGRGR